MPPTPPPQLQPLPHTITCKVCEKGATYFGAVDLSKNCEARNGLNLPHRGIPVHYHRCTACGLIFTTYMDAFSHDDFKALIYNDDYPLVDPDVIAKRPQGLTEFLCHNFGHAREAIRVLDYGCGNGQLVTNLRNAGFTAVEGYDPFLSEHATKPTGTFDLIVCTEVMEHVHDPHHLCRELAHFRAPNGLILVSTLLQPANINELGLNWWYAAPRNGHITLHTKASLQFLWQAKGLRCLFAGDNMHVALDTVPDFATHMF